MKVLSYTIFLGMILMGCATPSQVMIHPTTWQQADCSTWGYGWLGTPMALVLYRDCVNKFKVLGYIPAEEAEAKEPPKFDAKADPPASPCIQPIWIENSEWKYSVNDRIRYLRVLNKDTFRGQPVYVVLNSEGKHLLMDTSLGLMAILDKDNIEKEYSPPRHPYDWPLFIGKSWESSGIMKTRTGEIDVVTNYEIKGYGKVKVPAGVFDAFYIIGYIIVGKNDTKRIRIIELWYSPVVQYYVKAIGYTRGGRVTEELISYQHGDGRSTQK